MRTHDGILHFSATDLDDHLCLVAGSTRLQIKELRRQGIETMETLAVMPLPVQWKPERGAVQTYERLREQARVQVAGRNTGEPVYEPLESAPGFWLARLPAPSAGDVFFDLEGDPYCGEGGLEYLFGWVVPDSRGDPRSDPRGDAHYTPLWALSREEEKRAFEAFVDFIIAPYNAQVFELQERIPGARIGTVDKFQGQEAPVVIYSMATSTPAEAPHGMEFLYSLNRFNVATSRARCVSVLVANPALFSPECRTPRQMQLANAFCRYQELSETIIL